MFALVVPLLVAAADPRLAVLPLRAEAVQQNEADRLAATLRLRAQVRGFVVEPSDRTVQMLESAQSLGLTCDLRTPACAAEIGAVADVDVVVVGSAVGDDNGRIGLTLARVNTRTRAVERTVRALVPQNVDALGPAVDVVAAAFFDDAAALASVDATVAPAGAVVVVDGAAVQLPVQDLVPGEHSLRVTLPGHLPFQTRFVAVAGETVRHTVSLVVDENAVKVVSDPMVTVVPWVVAAVGGAVALTGAGAVAVGLGPAVSFNEEQAKIAEANRAPSEAGYPVEVAGRFRASEERRAEWNSWGQPLTSVGVAMAVLGVAAAAGGTIAALVLAPDDAP